MEGTRLRILQLLQKNESDTVDGLAKKIGLAPATIRRHLDILQRDRLVSFTEVRKKTGRPEYSFYLTEDGQEALPKDYDQLLGMVVQELSAMSRAETDGKDGHQILESVFRRMSERVAIGYKEGMASANIADRVNALVDHLVHEDFSPDPKVEDGALRIRLLNCPFRSVAMQNKAVCTFDLHLIGSLLDADVERTQCIHDGDSGCTYTVPLTATAERELSFLA